MEEILELHIRAQWPFRAHTVIFTGSPLIPTVKKGKWTIFDTSQYDITKDIEVKHLKEWPLEKIVPKQYHEFLPLIGRVMTGRLPPPRPGIDYEVRSKKGKAQGWEPLYSISRVELSVLKGWLEDNLLNDFIQQSSSPIAAPALSAKKPDGGLQFCTDYRDINSKTNNNLYPLPLLWEKLNLLQ